MIKESSISLAKHLATRPWAGAANRPDQRFNERGQALVFLIIVIAVIGGGVYFLYNMRRDSQVEGERFARQVIERCAFQHDVKFLHASVAADRRMAVPPAMDDQFIYYLTKMGMPDRNYTLTGELAFENYFSSPRGTYKTILTFPDQHATVFVSIARPSGIWFVTDFGVTWERPPG